MFMYGFTNNNRRLVFHSVGEPDRLKYWKTALNDPRFQPGVTHVVGYLDAASLGSLKSAAAIAQLFAQRQPAFVAVVVYDLYMQAAISDGTSFLRALGINARSFDNLQNMFDWVSEQEKQLTLQGGTG